MSGYKPGDLCMLLNPDLGRPEDVKDVNPIKVPVISASEKTQKAKKRKEPGKEEVKDTSASAGEAKKGKGSQKKKTNKKQKTTDNKNDANMTEKLEEQTGPAGEKRSSKKVQIFWKR